MHLKKKSHLKNSVFIGARLAAIWMLAVLPLAAAVDVALSTPESSQPVGSTFNLTASASDTANPSATFTYQFAVRQTTAPSYSVLKNFYKTNTLDWTPSTQEGIYYMHVIVNSSTGSTGDAYQTLIVTSRVTGSTPVVSPTRNPLVALYSAPPCASPYQVRVVWKAAADAAYRGTAFQQCNGYSLNFYIAGMKASTTYSLHQDVFNGSTLSTYGPHLLFTTGAVNTYIPYHHNVTSMQPPTEYTYPDLLRLAFTGPFATDNDQHVIWYLSPAQGLGSGYIARPVEGATFLGSADEPTAVCPQTNKRCGDHQFFREYDLAGNILRETNWTFLNHEVNALRASEGKAPVHLTFFSHEGIRLPNGDTATVVTDEEMKDQGDGKGLVDVLGDMVVVLDSNFQLRHQWDAFDYLDITRKALRNDICTLGGGGCPVLFGKQPNGRYYNQANDWTHVNSVFYDPKDGNLVVSIRHQAWIIKIDYENGSGNGHIVWTLGQDGNFTLSTGKSLDWFSYQHDAEFQSNGALTLFDNGNLRVSEHGGNSRGQAWSLDQTKLIATPILSVDLGAYSGALGSAALLSNGNYTFDAGYIYGNTSQTSEVTPSGSLVYRERTNEITYRSFRLSSLYGPY